MKTFLKIVAGLLLAGGLFFFAFYRTPEEKAFKKNMVLAQQGDAQAALELAQAYLNGVGTKPDTQKALEWYEQASAKGNINATWELAKLHMAPQGSVKQDLPAALVYMQTAAQNGLAPAQYELGNWYMRGEQVPKHEGQALYWYILAAQNGSAQAQTQVDDFATQKPQLAQGVNEFIQNLQQAKQENGPAMLALGKDYLDGVKVLQDKEESLKWLKKAWETSGQSSVEAALALQDYYNRQEPPQSDEAFEYLVKAAELKNADAQYALGEMAYTDNPPRFEDAFAWFSNAATQGHVRAQYMTGFMLLQGQGTAKSVPLAMEFFEQAANQNDADAQYVLGQIYLKGLGVNRNRTRGRAWLKLAAQNGSEAAKNMLN